MKKSKYVFLILALLYALIYILSISNIVVINENIMIGLTFSAFFMSLSDVCNNIIIYRMARNELGYICWFTCNVLQEFISSGITQTPLVNVVNMKKNIECLVPNYKGHMHPNEFNKCNINKVISKYGSFCFILSIAFFVITPYLAAVLNEQISIAVTLLAFSIMCLNIYLEETIGDYFEKKNNFMNNTQIIIQSFLPGFIDYLNRCLYFNNELDTEKKH